MRKKRRCHFAYGFGLLLKCVEVVFAQCNGTAQQIRTIEPLQGYLTSPGFPKAYDLGLHCIYKLEAPTDAGLVIQINVVELDLLGYFSGSNQCLRDYLLLIIIDRSGKKHVSQRYCGHLEGFSLPILNTLQSKAEVVFVSSYASPMEHRGFRIHYSFARESNYGVFLSHSRLSSLSVDVQAPPSFYYDSDNRYRRDCGGSTEPNEISGEVNSPGFPFTYPRNVTCNW